MLEGNYIECLNQSVPDIMGFVTAPIIQTIGAPLLYIWICFITFGMLYIKNGMIIIPAMMGLIVAGAFASALPSETHGIILILMSIAIAVIPYRYFHRE